MGTATLTRSQSRRTRSECTADSVYKTLASPLEVLPGNHVNSSLRRTGIPKKLSGCVDKENAPPNHVSLKEIKACLNEQRNTADSSLQKASKKRRRPVRASEESSGAGEASDVVREDLEIPVISGIDPNGVSVEEDRPQLESGCRDESNMHRRASNEEDRKAHKQHKNTEELCSPSPSALALLQNNYDKLFLKYQKLKAKRLNEHEALYNEQNARIFDFVQATEALIEFYKGENALLRQQLQEANIPELISRSRSLEIANSESRSCLVQEQSKNLELRQENKKLKSLLLEHIAHVQTLQSVPPQACQKDINNDMNKEQDASVTEDNDKLVKKLLESVLGLGLQCSGNGADGNLHFEHGPTGFSFNLKQVQDVEVAELIAGGELRYENVSLGVCRKVVGWMKEKEVVFGMEQAQLLFKRLTGFLNRGAYG